MAIPLVDLEAQYSVIGEEVREAIQEVMGSAGFIGGPRLSRFEESFARYCGAPHAVGAGNGTDALALALWASGIGDGDEVITVPNTFIATAEAISLVGARPVFVDVEDDTMTMSAESCEAAITPATRAVIPVHLYGQTADMKPIMETARRHGLTVVEDACQAHGAEYAGTRAGTLGDCAAFSFYPGKNLGACGDAGAVVTRDAHLAREVRMLANHGRLEKYEHAKEGINSRLDSLQAAILTVKLGHLDRWNQARRDLAGLYSEGLAGIEGLRLPREAEGRRHVYHLYVVRTSRRDDLLDDLRSRDIGAGMHYPIPLHLQEAYEHLGLGPGTFPNAERACREVLSLPLFPEMSPGQVNQVCDAVRRFHGTRPS